jgi:hypothetical protein
MSAEVSIVPKDCLMMVWPAVVDIYTQAPLLQEKFGPQELLTLLTVPGTGYELWTAADGALEGIGLTALVHGNLTNKLHIVDLYCKPLAKYLAQGIEKLERYACLVGADEIVFDGRDGWERVMSRFGYAPKLQMRKNVRMLWAN